MAKWLQRTALAGASVNPNGTASHTCTFTAATSGNYLVAVVAGAVTFSTPAGWTLLASAVNEATVYVFTKTATAGESSFTTTHNGSNYAIRGVVYEFPVGTTSLSANYQTGVGTGTVTTPALSGLTGTYTLFGARAHGLTTSGGTIDATWITPSTEDYEVYVGASTIDGAGLSVAYADDMTVAAPALNYALLTDNTATTTGESVIFALNVPGGSGGGAAINKLHIGSGAPTNLFLGTTQVTAAYLGTTQVWGLGSAGDPEPTLYLTPATGNYNTGDTVQVVVRVDSQSTEINAVQANFTYPTNRLTYQSMSFTGSPYTTQVQQTGGSGEVRIASTILADSTTGDQLVATVTFTATGAGSANLDFMASSKIAAYADATDVLGETTGAAYVIS